MMPDKIQCMVGDQERIIDFDVFIDVHEQLANYYRGKGMTGDALDYAINVALPQRLSSPLARTRFPARATDARPDPWP
jgi:hypothetical protein